MTQGSKGWLNETHGGGFYMSDNDWVRSLNNKGIYTGGQLKGGSVRSDSDLSAGGILKLDKVNVAGEWCPQNGAISHDSSGGILSCQSGRWKSNNTADTRVVWGNPACFPSDAPSVAVCPARTQVTGCGYVLTSFWGGTNAPDSFAPVADGTACTLSVGKAPQACFKVWAACR